MPQETSKGDDQTVSAKISNLENATIVQLRAKWTTVIRVEPPTAFGPDVLRRSLAQYLQERTFGGLSRIASRDLDRAVQALVLLALRHNEC